MKVSYLVQLELNTSPKLLLLQVLHLRKVKFVYLMGHVGVALGREPRSPEEVRVHLLLGPGELRDEELVDGVHRVERTHERRRHGVGHEHSLDLGPGVGCG